MCASAGLGNDCSAGRRGPFGTNCKRRLVVIVIGIVVVFIVSIVVFIVGIAAVGVMVRAFVFTFMTFVVMAMVPEGHESMLGIAAGVGVTGGFVGVVC